jgi:DNA polymerase III subunit epsilon
MLKRTVPTIEEILADPKQFTFLRNLGIENYRFNDDVGDELNFLVVDFETTGFKAKVDEAIEIGLTLVSYSPSKQRPTKIVENYQAFECPTKPISAETTQITGITQEMVNDARFSDEKVNEIVLKAEWLVAHNSKFDRPFWDHRFPNLSNLQWACSFSGIDWYSKHFSSRALQFLASKYGFSYEAHRACSDTVATAVIISQDNNFEQLLNSLNADSVQVFAYGAPFCCKDQLSSRKYNWKYADENVWHKTIDETDLIAEKQWLDELYHDGSSCAAYRYVTANERFKNE